MQIRIGTKSNISISAKRAADGLIAAISVAYTITRGSTSCHRKIEPTNTVMRRIRQIRVVRREELRAKLESRLDWWLAHTAVEWQAATEALILVATLGARRCLRGSL
jgi:hypothetical protein